MRIETVTDEAGLALCREIRKEVFVVEQAVPPADEWDDKDPEATHYLLYIDGKTMGTARLRILGEMAKLERIAIRKAARGRGAGAAMLQHLLQVSQAIPGVTYAKLHGQVQARAFYEKMGFASVSEEYLEAGIPHRKMERHF